MNPKLLIVDDERGIVDMIQSYFQTQYDIRCLSCRMGQPPLKRQVVIPHILEWGFTAAEFYVKNMVAD